MGDEIRRLGIVDVGGVLLDLGVSSFQLDEGARGFSYRGEGKLDMRMDRRQLLSAFDVVNGYSEQSLVDLLFRYGEERQARRIARAIISGRPVNTAAGLRRAVEDAVGSRFVLKSLARVFQALRIEVNRELDNLAAVLAVAVELLLPGGRLVVISYHSLEDRIVKEFFRRESATVVPSGHKLVPDVVRAPLIRVLTVRPRVAAPEEVAANPRARSAKLRAAEKLSQTD
jgi:16S rRNA (cytosine1402-N4)-methyltransferase